MESSCTSTPCSCNFCAATFLSSMTSSGFARSNSMIWSAGRVAPWLATGSAPALPAEADGLLACCPADDCPPASSIAKVNTKSMLVQRLVFMVLSLGIEKLSPAGWQVPTRGDVRFVYVQFQTRLLRL